MSLQCDIRSYGKDRFCKVPDSPHVQSKSKIKQWEFIKPYLEYFHNLRASNKRGLRELVRLRNETGYWKQSQKNLFKAIFDWNPNEEKFRQRKNALNVYDPRNSTYVYDLPPTSAGQDLPKPKSFVNRKKKSTGQDLSTPESYIYRKDYKKMYKVLLIMHGRLMQKLMKQKRLLRKTKSTYSKFLELTCFPVDGLPVANAINASKKKPAPFAPGFVRAVDDPWFPSTTVEVLPQTKEPVTPQTKKPVTPQTKKPVSGKDVVALSLPMRKEATTPPIDKNKSSALASPNTLSPPASPTRKDASHMLVETPQKKTTRKRAMESPSPAQKKPKRKSPIKRSRPKRIRKKLAL